MVLKKLLLFFSLTALPAFLTALVFKNLVGGFYLVSSNSMEPSLEKDSYVFVDKTAYRSYGFYKRKAFLPEKGDVVLVRLPQGDLTVKRVVGVPGDLVEYRTNRLYVNGEKRTVEREGEARVRLSRGSSVLQRVFPFIQKENRLQPQQGYEFLWEKFPSKKAYPILIKKELNELPVFAPKRVPEGYYFLMGDNRNHSRDSRFLPPAYSKGRGVVTFSRLGPGGPLSVPKGTLVYGKNSFGGLELFVTLKDQVVEGLFKDIEVQAVTAGLNGNIPGGAILGIKGRLSYDFRVGNADPFSGGEDQTLVPLQDILGQLKGNVFSL